MANERIGYLDTLKGIGIIMVVFCHYCIGIKDTSILQNVIMTLCWSAVPCFMMVSGGLMLNSKTFSYKKWRTRLFRFIAVLFVWRIIYFLLGEIVLRSHFGISELLSYLFLFQDFPGLDTDFMWYMMAFIAIQTLYPVFYMIFNDEEHGEKLSLLIMGLAYFSRVGIYSLNFIFERLSFHTGRAQFVFDRLGEGILLHEYSNMLVYFILGGFLLKYHDRIKEKLPSKVLLPIAMIAVGTFGLMVVKHAVVGNFTWASTYLPQGYHWTSTIILSLGVYLLVSMNDIPGTKPVQYIGTLTMGIYYIHYITLILADYFLFGRIERVLTFGYGLNTIKTVIWIALCMGITLGLKKIPVVKRLVE